MRFKIGKVVLVIFSAIVMGVGQNRSGQPDQYVLAPREIGLVTVAYQPNSPVQFENAEWYVGLEGGRFYSYDIRNKGNKPIRWIAVGDSTGNRWTWGVGAGEQAVRTGDLIPKWAKYPNAQTIGLTDDLRQRLKLQGGMRGITVLMIIRVEFADGTIYDDEPVYKALLTYLEELQGKLDRLEYILRERSVKESRR